MTSTIKSVVSVSANESFHSPRFWSLLSKLYFFFYMWWSL